ncbi:MAG: SDR family oxidoreductase [Pseudomonadota bacterium]
MKLLGKVAVVTGGASGMGKATADLFLQEGASVVIADWNKELLPQVLGELQKKYGADKVIGQAANLGKEADIEAMVRKAVDQWGRLDIVVNCAGVTTALKKVMDIDRSEWDHTLGINLTGSVLATKYAARQMMAQGQGGKIVLISSGVSKPIPTTGYADYMVSKAGVNAFTTIAALELADHNINVNAIAPGTIQTGMIKDYDLIPGLKQLYAEATPLKRLGEPEDIAAAALFFCSRDSDYITGQTLFICGGSTLRGADIYPLAKDLREKSQTMEKERKLG